MKLTIDRAELSEAMSVVSRATPVNATTAALAGVFIQASTNGSVSLTGTDTDITVCVTVSGEVATRGSALVPARKLYEAARALESERVVLETDDNRMKLTAGTFRGFLRLLPAGNFPAIAVPDGKSITLSPADFLAASRQVTRAASDNEARPHLTGVLLESSMDALAVNLVATDSIRLARRQLEVRDINVTTSALLPRRAVEETARAVQRGVAEDAELEILVDEGRVTFRLPTFWLSTTLLEGQFPDYRALLPQRRMVDRVTVDRAELSDAVRRVSLLADALAPVVVTTGADRLTLACSTPGVGEAKDRVAAEPVGEPETVAYSPALLADGLDAVKGERAEIQVGGAVRPAIIMAEGDDSFKYLLMPTRSGS